MLKKLGKEKGMESINDWIQSCINHLYWSATSTFDGNGDVILANFKVFLCHIANEHENLDNLLFDRCRHGPDFTNRKWMRKGM